MALVGVTISFNDLVLNLDLPPTTSILDLRGQVSAIVEVLPSNLVLVWNGRKIAARADLTIQAVGIRDGDLIVVMEQEDASAPAQQPDDNPYSPQKILDYFLSNPAKLSQLHASNPRLAEAIVSRDMVFLERFSRDQMLHAQREQEEREREERLMRDDPFNPEVQKKIEEQIRQKSIMENMEAAMEHNPASFASVVMLFIDCEVNKVPMKAMIDSGAQITLMSASHAKKCGIMRLVDKRFSSMLVGVGNAESLGRVHMVDIKIGNRYFPCSFTIVESDNLEFLIGLDTLRQHSAMIDLKRNKLVVDDEEVDFLSEKDIPKKLNQSLSDSLSSSGSGSSSSAPPASASASARSSLEVPSPSLVPPIASGPFSSLASHPSAPAAAAAAAPASAPAPAPAAQFPEETIRSLMEIGMSREQAIQSLVAANGNFELAASLWFQ